MLKPDSEKGEIYCCAVSDGRKSIAYPWHGAAIEATRQVLLSSVPKRAFNQKFEQRWTLAKLGIEVNNWRFDGMIGAHVLDNRRGITGLKFQSFVRLGVDSYDDAIKPYLQARGGSNDRNRISEAPLDTVLRYCAMDALLEWLVDEQMERELEMLP